MAAPNLETYKRNSMFEASFRRSSMFDDEFRQSLRDRLLPQQTTGCSCDDITPVRFPSYRYFSDKITAFLKKSQDVFAKAWEMGTADPRKIIFSAKMGFAMTIMSVLIFFKVPGSELTNHYLWAILTVVVIFEFSVGATFSKGFNRGLGTLSAGGLALGMAVISDMLGNWAEVFNAFSIFVVAFLANYGKLYQTMKPYEYGFRVFLLTYCYIIVSGYRTGEFMETAVSRFLMIALGACVGLGVNTCIYPIWAGDDLHNLVVMNFSSVATSLEGCVRGYLDCVSYDTVPSKILVYEAVTEDPVYSGYRSAVQSTSQEDTLMAFASWEPPHGPYKSFRYPWNMYVKVSGALRYCAFMVMALHGCILSEIQAAEEKRQEFRNELRSVGEEGAKVLRHIGEKLKKMERLNPNEDILFEIHQAAEQLQSKIDKKSYLLVNAKNWEIGNQARDLNDEINISEDLRRVLSHKSKSEFTLRPPINWDDIITPRNSDLETTHLQSVTPETLHTQSRSVIHKTPSWPSQTSTTALSMPQPQPQPQPQVEATRIMYESASAISLATFASLLIEFVARLGNLVKAYDELCDKANFKEVVVVNVNP